MVCTVIDHLTSMVHLIPCRQDYTAKEAAEMVFDEIYKHHGLPEIIVSDRDSLFTSHFWDRLHKLIGTELRMSSSWHPQIDGATERANRTLGQMLRQAIGPSQRDWVSKLSGIESAINSSRSETTGFSPFFLNYGRLPRPLIWDTPSRNEYKGVRTFTLRMKEAIMQAHDSIIEARIKQARQANKKQRNISFQVGDLVYLSTKNLSLPKGRSRKLTPKFVGPYSITKELESNSMFSLDLPPELKKRGIHNAFHASLLHIHIANDDRRFPGRQIHQVSTSLVSDTKEWEVDRELSHTGTGREAQFELKWKSGDVTWEPWHIIKKLKALQEYCELMGIGNTRQLGAVVGN
ncbi:hypothetical protein M422DRAFT_84881, partial [Sphaerobolus stellatus SS14]